MRTVPPLLNRARDVWDGVLRTHPELGPAIDLQMALLSTVIDELSALEQSSLDDRSRPDPGTAADRLRRGEPALGSPVELPPGADPDSVVIKLCRHLVGGGAEAARRIEQDIGAGRLNASSLVAASLAREQGRIRAAACQLGFAPDLLWLIAELAAGPIAFLFQRELIRSSTEVAALTSGWPHGFCPICGSWPALAEVTSSRRGASKLGDRVLRCSFCAAAWQPQHDQCIYCGENGEAFAVTTPDLERPDRRLEVCGACRGYLKSVPADTPTPFPLLAVEDLASLDLDRAAGEGGYVRPPMLRFGTGD